jgi:tetratricopeptide (TPR) repeat protein
MSISDFGGVVSAVPEPVNQTVDRFAGPPDAGQADTLDDLVARLRWLKVWAGDPSYEVITGRINTAWLAAGRPPAEAARKSTVADCFKTGRRRINTDLVIAIVEALHPDAGYVAQWRQALRIIGGETQAAAQVRVQDTLPPDSAEFTGRSPELDQLRQALHHARHNGGAVVISAIEGMAGVGKTQLAVHAGHLLTRETPLDRVLFVNLRGFDPSQPPADPAAVLDGFLRLLGVPGQQIPHDLTARVAAYRNRLAGTQSLVVLDNAADAEQARPLVAGTPGCLTLVTSRRSLTDLRAATHLTVDVFTPDEAIAFLSRAVPDVAAGADPHAAARIADRCGHLPLALGLVAGHIRSTPGWTLTDHADRLDERHHHGQLDTGVQLALHLSYQHLAPDRQRLLRLLSLHPGQDFDAYAAAALTDVDLPAIHDHVRDLCDDHLLQRTTPGRYRFHDLVRAYAAGRAVDQDRPPQRRTALTRLFDFYLVTAATAMDVAYPHERQRRPAIPATGVTTPDLADGKRADHWLDNELTNLLAAAQHATQHGWPEHAWQLSGTLDQHLCTRGQYRDAQTLHEHALHVARQFGNPHAEMNALNSLGNVHWVLGHYEQADDHYRRAVEIARDTGDRAGELLALIGLGDVNRALNQERADDYFRHALQIARDIGDRVGERDAVTGLGFIHRMLGHYEQSAGYFRRALQIAQDSGDRAGELDALGGLGHLHRMLGHHEEASDLFGRALHIARDTGDRGGEMWALGGLSSVQRTMGRYEQAGDHCRRALQIAQAIGDRSGELSALAGLGHLHLALSRHSEAADWYQQVLDLARIVGSSNWQYEALQGLGRVHHATGQPGLALAHHQQALQLATELDQPADQVRAHDGLAHAHHALGQHDQARQHWQHALDILTGLGTDHAEEPETNVANIRAHLANLGVPPPAGRGNDADGAGMPREA